MVFGILPRNTLGHGVDESGIDPPTFYFSSYFFFKKVNDMLSGMYIKTSFKNYMLHVLWLSSCLHLHKPLYNSIVEKTTLSSNS